MQPARGKRQAMNRKRPKDEAPGPMFYAIMGGIFVLILIIDWLLMTAQVIPM